MSTAIRLLTDAQRKQKIISIKKGISLLGVMEINQKIDREKFYLYRNIYQN